MKIAFTGGGSGGHFYPLIAVAEEVNALVDERHLVKPDLYYLSESEYDPALLYENEIEFRRVVSGKRRVYASPRNMFDMFKVALGVPAAFSQLLRIYPDVLFSKGGYVSVPVVYAAHLLRIPIFIHDSDAVPGRANLWASKYAQRIAVSYPEAATHFAQSADHIACVGNPVRKSVRSPLTYGAHGYFQFLPELPTLFIVGGSQGAEAINNTVFQALGELLDDFQVIHQVGRKNYVPYKELLGVTLKDHPHIGRYRLFPYMSALEIRTAAGAADLVVSRAGSGSIFEIACWEKPSILVPIPEEVSRDQRQNAFAYARAGCAQVIEQDNFTPHILLSEVRRLHGDPVQLATMRENTKKFARPGAARTIAEELVAMALKHEL